MDLSIVIVNYNVKHFLQQCLQSVHDACKEISAEVFVVDNKSVDGSVEMLRQQFPWVKLIASNENLGFSKGNNLAIKEAVGEYILLLNPDTVVQEDTFTKCLSFAKSHPDLGGLGVKMIDGSGAYLPESKRGLPAPATAVYKMIGLSSLFPKSKRFARYYLGHLSKDENHEIEVLSGAYMFMKKECLDKVGYLDESFFMYGEDIDLSYRITLGGYKNYYLADTSIIHYKGESTKKGSINYVKVFYQAMILYAQKHFTGQQSRVFVSLIKIAVYVKAILALLAGYVKNSWFFIAELILLYFLFRGFGSFYQEQTGVVFPQDIYQIALYILPIFILLIVAISGGYRKGSGFSRLVKSLATAWVLLGFTYSMLPEDLRFSRLFIFCLPFISLPLLIIFRFGLYKLGYRRFFNGNAINTLIVGKKDTKAATSKAWSKRNPKDQSIFWEIADFHNLEQLKLIEEELIERVRVQKIDEIVFLNESLKNETIIALMSLSLPRDVQYKIVPREADFIIGSGSKDARGELRYIEAEPLFSRSASLKKRWADMGICLLVLLLSPYLILKNKPLQLFYNLFEVFFAKKHWIGLNSSFIDTLYDTSGTKGVLSVANEHIPEQSIIEINRNYCKNYTWKTDFDLFWRGLNKLDQR